MRFFFCLHFPGRLLSLVHHGEDDLNCVWEPMLTLHDTSGAKGLAI